MSRKANTCICVLGLGEIHRGAEATARLAGNEALRLAAKLY